MMRLLWSRIGTHAVRHAVGGHREGSRLNIKLGFALLSSRRVGAWPKMLALAVGAAVAAGVVALEIPVESILAVLLPGLGLAMDLAADGAEAVVVSVLVASLLLPFIAPRGVVDAIIAERAGVAVPTLPSVGA